jgi:hypothetical protein
VNNLAFLDGSYYCLIGRAIEWQASYQHEVEDYSDAPNIDFFIMIILENFRRAIVWAVETASVNVDCLKCLSASNIEVNQFDVNLSSLSEENVAASDVSMNNALLMKVED